MTQRTISTLRLTILALILVGGFMAFNFFFMQHASADTPTSGVTNVESAIINRINAIQLDTSFLSSQVYQSLVDSTVVIAPQVPGRPNPFAPLAPASKPTTTTKTPTTHR